MPEDNQNLDNYNISKKWYFKWWVILIFIAVLIIFIFLVYLGILVYNEYQNINKDQMTQSSSIEKFINSRKTVDQNDLNLNFSDDPYLGSPLAKVKIIEFGDFQCPFCRESFSIIRKLAIDYGDQVQIVYRDYPLTIIHPEAQKAAEAAGCAQVQGQFWQYHDKLFLNQENLTEDYLLIYASELNLDFSQFKNCLDSGQRTAEVLADYNDGKALGISGTPTFFINGVMIEGSLNEEQFKLLIEYFSTSQTESDPVILGDSETGLNNNN